MVRVLVSFWVALFCFGCCGCFVVFCFGCFGFWFGLDWIGLVWFGSVWFGLVWFGFYSFSPLFISSSVARTRLTTADYFFTPWNVMSDILHHARRFATSPARGVFTHLTPRPRRGFGSSSAFGDREGGLGWGGVELLNTRGQLGEWQLLFCIHSPSLFEDEGRRGWRGGLWRLLFWWVGCWGGWGVGGHNGFVLGAGGREDVFYGVFPNSFVLWFAFEVIRCGA